MNQDWLESVKWDANGLVTAVAQDALTKRVLMVAWMNREALIETATTRRAVYFSRSRQRLWRKGEESGHIQNVQEIRLDCDADVVLLLVEQVGGIACHTGRESCMYFRLQSDESFKAASGSSGTLSLRWEAVDPVLKDPKTFYALSAKDPHEGGSA
ncbi:MAG: phosphoribosyl-AMP cyclohydrolase [Betaproteobacteria bacterium]|jgi:phosphoribosyl-AMP cyclohydrolase|nr:phosphoribosyl-AMP cyclohydrolase [Betaproteobacteria bacterium]